AVGRRRYRPDHARMADELAHGAAGLQVDQVQAERPAHYGAIPRQHTETVNPVALELRLPGVQRSALALDGDLEEVEPPQPVFAEEVLVSDEARGRLAAELEVGQAEGVLDGADILGVGAVDAAPGDGLAVTAPGSGEHGPAGPGQAPHHCAVSGLPDKGLV